MPFLAYFQFILASLKQNKLSYHIHLVNTPPGQISMLTGSVKTIRTTCIYWAQNTTQIMLLHIFHFIAPLAMIDWDAARVIRVFSHCSHHRTQPDTLEHRVTERGNYFPCHWEDNSILYFVRFDHDPLCFVLCTPGLLTALFYATVINSIITLYLQSS